MWPPGGTQSERCARGIVLDFAAKRAQSQIAIKASTIAIRSHGTGGSFTLGRQLVDDVAQRAVDRLPRLVQVQLENPNVMTREPEKVLVCRSRPPGDRAPGNLGPRRGVTG